MYFEAVLVLFHNSFIFKDLLYYSILFNDKYRSNLPRIIITTTHRSKTKQTCRLKERERFYWCAFSRVYSLSLFSSLSLGELAPIQFLSNGLYVRIIRGTDYT